MTIQSGYVAFTSKMAEDFVRESEGIMPQSFKENIKKFFENAKARVEEKKTELEEMPEGALEYEKRQSVFERTCLSYWLETC